MTAIRHSFPKLFQLQKKPPNGAQRQQQVYTLCGELKSARIFHRKEYPMSPKILKEGAFIFWFHSYDARYEERASVHIGKGSQDDFNDAKVWLEPEIEIARPGHTLKEHELRQALTIVQENHTFLLEEWYGYKRKAS
jgi:hypothetical protein